MISYTKQLQRSKLYDIIVVGSGSSGATAAIAAGRKGADVLIVEQQPFIGGTSTAVLDTIYGFYTPGKESKKVVGGVADDVVQELDDYNVCFKRPNSFGAGTGVTYHPEYLKVVWEKLLREAGCSVLLNAWVQDVIVNQERIESIVVATKAGLKILNAKLFIDATGDADLVYYSGFPYEVAGNYMPAQSLTTTFKMVNVDIKKRKSISKDELHRLMRKAVDSEKYDLPFTAGSDHVTPVNGMMATVMTRLKSYVKKEEDTLNATDPELLSKSEIMGRRQALEYVRFLNDFIPGYEKAQLSTFSSKIGVRESRRIYGDYRLTAADVLEVKQFDDQIGLCGAPLEDHHDGDGTKWQYLPEGKCAGIPYRSLIPKNSENLLAVGRCFSADHVAHTSVRSMAQCMAMGQAAGTAMSLALNENESPREVSITKLRNILRKDGAILEEE